MAPELIWIKGLASRGLILYLLDRSVECKHYLFADILAEAAKAIAGRPAIDDSHREPLLKAATNLERALLAAPARIRTK